jgi:hypothetical protein
VASDVAFANVRLCRLKSRDAIFLPKVAVVSVQHIPDAPEHLRELLQRLYRETAPVPEAAGGFLVSQRLHDQASDDWYAGWAGDDIGPYDTAEDAIIAGVRWLYGLAADANKQAKQAEIVLDRVQESEARALEAHRHALSALRAAQVELMAEREAQAQVTLPPLPAMFRELAAALEREHEQPPYTSMYDAYAALAKQARAFFDAGRTWIPAPPDAVAIRAEALQLAALALKAMADLAPEEAQ